MVTDNNQRRGAIKALIVFLLIAAVVPVGALLATRAIQGPEADAGMQRMHLGVRMVVAIAMGLFGSLGAVVSYLFVLFTTCFTFRFDRPVYAGFKKRLYLANIVIP